MSIKSENYLTLNREIESMQLTSIYQNPLWGKIQEPLESGQFNIFEYKENNGNILYPFIKRNAGNVDGIDYYDLATPRGECGPLLSGNVNIGEYKKAFNQYCTENNIIAEFIKFSPWIDVSSVFDNWYSIRKYGYLYEVDLRTDFFKESFNSKLRNIVRKALKNNIDVQIDQEGKMIDEFLRLYKYTESKNHVSKYYMIDEPFIKKYFDDLPGNVCFYNAFVDGQLASSAMFVDSIDIRHYHFSANNPAYKAFNSNSLILFKAALDAKDKGLKLMDLGGATPGSSLEHYKRQFVREDQYLEYSVGTRIVNQRIYDVLTEKSRGGV